jgi:serine/threonine-protein kinase RsbW
MNDVPPSPPSDFEPETLRFPIDVRIPSDVRFIEHIVGVVVRRCAEQDLPRRYCNLNVPVALTEALANAIRYGNHDDPSKSVRLRATVDDRSLVFEIGDEGTGFDLDTSTIDPTRKENLTRENGRGLYLMRRLMDRVERYTDHGNVVRLTLHRK